MKPRRKFRYRFFCPQAKLEDLEKMVKGAKEISAKLFEENCAVQRFIRILRYPGNKKDLLADRCVTFYKSTWKGKPCFYLDWSAYECVFLNP